MTPKERMYAAIEGRKPDVWPVAAPYIHLTYADHWEALTGLPVWQYYEWLMTTDMNRLKDIYRLIVSTLPFDIISPFYHYSDEYRENTEIVLRNGEYCYHFKKEDQYAPVPENIHNAGSGGGEKETRYIYSKEDARERLKLVKAEQLLQEGEYAYRKEFIKLFADQYFINMGGVVNTFYSNCYHVGMTNFYAMLHEEPDLIKYISGMVLEQNIEYIRAMSTLEGDAIQIDDATATSDMISPRMYEEFSLPYLTEQVKEIQRLGKKAIVLYFGGISDRVEQIASSGADILMMECSMKGYTNDYADIAAKLNGRMCLAGNLNPYVDIQITDDDELALRISKMARAGIAYGRYFTSAGSPLTPGTTVERMKKYIQLAHSL